MRLSEPAPAKLNLALHVRGKLPDGRHALETVFAFCTDGDRLEAGPADTLSLEIRGPFAPDLANDRENLVLRAGSTLAEAAGIEPRASLTLVKNLPLSSGIGGGSADAGATLRLLTRLWKIDPVHALDVAPDLGSDVPACLLSLTVRGEGPGDQLQPVEDSMISGSPVLLVNPRVEVSTRDVFAAWDGVDRGPLGDWREGRNDLEVPARSLAPAIGDLIDWLKQQDGANFVRMSGSGATCFALFETERKRDDAAAACPSNWWHLATFLR
jgi:4-diphosphocytidyl-2-C-methyl-D-erythritol kinase